MEKTTEIMQHLHEVEQEYDVKVLMAVEAGSRAWGIESYNSDWDLRFVYVHKPQWYLGLDRKRDVIEHLYQEERIDLVGWDLKKALVLLRESNPALFEWLHSPTFYEKDDEFMQIMDREEDNYFSPIRMMYHYQHMYLTHESRYLKRTKGRMKLFFYYLRGILGCKWIEQRQSLPPVPFKELVEATVEEAEIKEEIDRLIHIKKTGKETENSAVSAELFEYSQNLAAYYTDLGRINRPMRNQTPSEELDAIFYHLVMNFN